MSNASDNLFSFIVDSEEKVPLHLRTEPHPSTTSTGRNCLQAAVRKDFTAGDGKVQMAGAIEFQARTNPGTLTDYCDPDELHMRRSERRTGSARSTIHRSQRVAKETKEGLKQYLRESNIDSMMAIHRQEPS